MINLHNSKAEARLRNIKNTLNDVEWGEYLAEHPEFIPELEKYQGPDERYVDGKTAIEVFRESIEYMPRSLLTRPLQVYFVRKMMYLLNEEKRWRVLDYGCGAGNVGIMFGQLGFDVDLLEVEGVHTEFLKWRVKKHFLDINVLGEEDKLGQYDLVTFFNVLEHTMDPMHVLERITNSLVKGGYLAMLFNSHGDGLDVTTMKTWEKTLQPYVLQHFTIMPNTDNMVYVKK